MISDIRLNAISLASGDSVEGEAATIEDGRGGGGMSSGRSMPRYPYKSASARARARLPDAVDRPDVLYAEFWLGRSGAMTRFSDCLHGIGGTGGTGSEVGEGVQNPEGGQLLKRAEPFWLMLRRSPALETCR